MPAWTCSGVAASSATISSAPSHSLTVFNFGWASVGRPGTAPAPGVPGVVFPQPPQPAMASANAKHAQFLHRLRLHRGGVVFNDGMNAPRNRHSEFHQWRIPQHLWFSSRNGHTPRAAILWRQPDRPQQFIPPLFRAADRRLGPAAGSRFHKFRQARTKKPTESSMRC